MSNSDLDAFSNVEWIVLLDFGKVSFCIIFRGPSSEAAGILLLCKGFSSFQFFFCKITV